MPHRAILPFAIALPFAILSTERGFSVPADTFFGNTFLFDDYMVYGRWESLAGEDLNGDGDTADSVLQIETRSTGETQNTGLAIPSFRYIITGETPIYNVGTFAGPRFETGLLVYVPEADQGRDLNGDGDQSDLVLHHLDLSTGHSANTGWAVFDDIGSVRLAGGRRHAIFWVEEMDQGLTDLDGDGEVDSAIPFSVDLATGATRGAPFDSRRRLITATTGDWLAMVAEEGEEDLNGDGEGGDTVAMAYDLERGTVLNTKLAVYWEGYWSPWTWGPVIRGGKALVSASEQYSARDLNGDGDWDDRILHVVDLESGVSTNLGLPAVVLARSGSHVLLEVLESPGNDLDGDGDDGADGDPILHTYDFDSGQLANLRLVGTSAIPAGPISEIEWIESPTGHLENGTEAPPSPLFVLSVSEERQSTDLNQDGDIEDWILHIHDTRTGRTTNLKTTDTGEPAVVSLDQVAFTAFEEFEGSDLNGNGVIGDMSQFVFDAGTGAVHNTGFSPWSRPAFTNRHLVFEGLEELQQVDGNQDGDLDDPITIVAPGDGSPARTLPYALRFAGRDRILVSLSKTELGAYDPTTDSITPILSPIPCDAAPNPEYTFLTRGFSRTAAPCEIVQVHGNHAILRFWETLVGSDLNQNGFLGDTVMTIVNLPPSTVPSTLAVSIERRSNPGFLTLRIHSSHETTCSIESSQNLIDWALLQQVSLDEGTNTIEVPTEQKTSGFWRARIP